MLIFFLTRAPPLALFSCYFSHLAVLPTHTQTLHLYMPLKFSSYALDSSQNSCSCVIIWAILAAGKVGKPENYKIVVLLDRATELT